MCSQPGQPLIRWLTWSVLIGVSLSRLTSAQTPDSSEQDVRYLQGLVELGLKEVIESYLTQVEREDSLKASLLRLETHRLWMNHPEVTPSRREQHLEHLLNQRRELIEANESNPRSAVWMADQAQDALDHLFTLDASGLTSLYGNPGARQQSIASRAAKMVDEYATLAQAQIDRVIQDLEIHPDFRNDVELQMRHRRLVEQERDGRIAYLRGVGGYLHAMLNLHRASDRESYFRNTIASLDLLASRLTGSLGVRATLYRGLARGQLGEFDLSEDILKQVIDDVDALPVDVFGARMGLVSNEQLSMGAESALIKLEAMTDRYAHASALFYRVLIADRIFLLRKRLAEMDDEFSLANAYHAYLDLLDIYRGIDEQLRAIVFARLVNASDEDTPLDQLPALVSIAKASHLARDQGETQAATAMLVRLLESVSLSESEKPMVLFELGKTLYASGDFLNAARRFLELAQKHPQDRRAEEAIELAANIAERQWREHPEDKKTQKLLKNALEVLLESYPNLSTIDRWRYASGKRAFREGNIGEASDLFKQVSSDSDLWPDALFMQAKFDVDHALATRKIISGFDPLPSALELLREVRPLLRDARESQKYASRRQDLKQYIGLLNVYEAELHLASGRPDEAIRLLDLIPMDSPPDKAILAQALEVRINALHETDRPELAQKAIERFLEAAPEQGAEVIGPVMGALLSEVNWIRMGREPDEALDLARRKLLPLAETMQRWIDSQEGEHLSLRVQLADAFRVSGQQDRALLIYGQLLKSHPGGMQLLFGKAECLFEIGDETRLGEAIMIYRRLGASDPGLNELSNHYYWTSQLRMLQILDLTGRNTNKIAPRIRRLRQIDRNLGGDRYRREFERLQNRHS
ncbi:MAG: tetratricopeptide repeat protein [Planctomycetota bacterium]|nr:tetratricopeptide repeat protein [Planctomycetota bacterium]